MSEMEELLAERKALDKQRWEIGKQIEALDERIATLKLQNFEKSVQWCIGGIPELEGVVFGSREEATQTVEAHIKCEVALKTNKCTFYFPTNKQGEQYHVWVTYLANYKVKGR